MRKILFSILLIMSTTTIANAGFFSSIAGGMVANSLSGNGSSSSYSAEGNSGAYFIMLNKKINILDLEINMLIGTSILFLILLIWILIRQGTMIKLQKKLLKKENIDYD